VFKASITVFPDLPSEHLDLIDAVQLQFKEMFVQQGLMVGEFHERNNTGGVRNPDMCVLRS